MKLFSMFKLCFQKLLNDVGKQFSGETTLSGALDEIHAKNYSEALNKLRTHLQGLQRAKTIQKQILKSKTHARKDQEPVSLMEKLQVDVQEKLIVAAEEKLKSDDAELSKTAKKKLGLIGKSRKRKAKGEQK